jgi:hypothetical protein
MQLFHDIKNCEILARGETRAMIPGDTARSTAAKKKVAGKKVAKKKVNSKKSTKKQTTKTASSSSGQHKTKKNSVSSKRKPKHSGELHQMIAEAAYLLAEQRNFVGGSPLDDWLTAEAEIIKQLDDSGD